MLNKQSFVGCINGSLQDKGYGPKRAKEIIDVFNRKADDYREAGLPEQTAYEGALYDTFREIEFRIQDRARGVQKMLDVQAEIQTRLKASENITTAWLTDGGSGIGRNYAAAIKSFYEADPRVLGTDLASMIDVYKGKYW